MITREDELNLDLGLNATFDGKKYQIFTPQGLEEYPIGGLICEYLRLVPLDIKSVILSCDGLEKEGTEDNYMKSFIDFFRKINREFPPVISRMIIVEFIKARDSWFTAVEEKRVEEYLSQFDLFPKVLNDLIFEGTSIRELGGDTVLQIMLSSYILFANQYVLTKGLFCRVMESDEIIDEEHKMGVEVFTAMFGSYMDMQHIDYRIILTENGFESLYTIKSSISLLIFDLAQCIKTNANIVKCKNCGNYFVPQKRSDSVYCTYPLHNNRGKTCKDVGAQITRANKEKNDLSTKEYRKVYMRLKMAMHRHPDNPEIKEKLSKLTGEIQDWRNKLSQGIVSLSEFIDWLKQF